MLAIDVPIAAFAAPPETAPADLASAQRQRSLAHAARHDILRRLAPALRHDMVVPLQSLGMTMEALSARLDRGAVAPKDLQAAVSKLNRLTRNAVASCLRVATWMEPSDDDSVPVHEGVDECVRLLASSLNFRGFHLRSEVPELPMDVSRCALRFLLGASLLTLADHAPGTGEIVLNAELAVGHAVVSVAWHAEADGAPMQVHDAGQATLSWTEVQALAAIEAVELRRSPTEIILRIPRAVVTTPLKMVPV